MILNIERGGYDNGAPIRLNGAFRLDGTSNPDVIRDGKSNCIESVVRESEGLFTVTFADGFPLPVRLTKEFASISQPVLPTVWAKAHVVLDSYSASTRSFQIQLLEAIAAGDTGAEVSDANDNDMVFFELKGSISSAGTDAA